MATKTEQKLIAHFKNRETFSRQELYDYFLQRDEDLKPTTFAWRVYDLKKKSILRQIKTGWYSISEKPVYTPDISDQIVKLSRFFKTHYKNAKYSIWNMDWLNEFTIHQFSTKCIFLETEKDLTSSLYTYLFENGYKNVLFPSQYNVAIPQRLYIEPILIQPLITRAPLQVTNLHRGEDVSIPTLEKILVDIFSDDKTFEIIHGAELVTIFKSAFNRYFINISMLYSYAERRGKGPEIKEFLLNHDLIKNDFL